MTPQELLDQYCRRYRLTYMIDPISEEYTFQPKPIKIHPQELKDNKRVLTDDSVTRAIKTIKNYYGNKFREYVLLYDEVEP